MIENEGFLDADEPATSQPEQFSDDGMTDHRGGDEIGMYQAEQPHDDGMTGHTAEFPMIAKTMAELEDVLAGELIALGANNVEIGTRMVSFTGDKALMYKANLHCRTALRILKPIYTFKAETADEVYEALKQPDWEEYLSPENTFSIDAVVYSHIFTHSKFVVYRVKDAIADWFMERYGKRPSVSVTNPDIVFNIHVAHNKCTLSLDSSGESLHKRGYRVAQTEAPISEVLAAGMILKSGWRGESTFIDPMCGSGTLLIEAAMIALGIPPGIHRRHFAFERWNDFDRELFSQIYNDDAGAKEIRHRIIGSDISPQAIAIAEKNIKNAGLKKYIDLQVKPFQQYTEAPASKGVLITNPPYGERLKVDDLDALYAMIGERLKHVFTGFNAYILSYRKESFDAIGLKPTRRFFLYNGELECEMREYEIFSGKRREHPKGNDDRDRSRRYDDLAERNSKEGYRRSQRASKAEEEKPRDESRRNKNHYDRVEEKPFISEKPHKSSPNADKPFKPRKSYPSSDKSPKLRTFPNSDSPRKQRNSSPNSDKPKLRNSSLNSDTPKKPRNSSFNTDKPFRSEKPFNPRESSALRGEERREPRSGKKFSDKDAKPGNFRKK